MYGLSWRDHQVMVGLGANSGARGPEVEPGNGVVPGLLDADSCPCVLDHDVVIRRVAGIARQIAFHVLAWLQLFSIDDLFALDPRPWLHRFFRLGFKWEPD